MTKRRDRGGGLSDDEARLWRHATRDVRTLPGGAAPPPEPPPPVAPAPMRAAPAAQTPRQPRLAHGLAPGLDKRTAQRLKRGQLPIEARLDLHGHGREAAHRALAAFISGGRAAGRRCVLVITGKGGRAGASGVLRAEVPEWLNGAEMRPHVLSFCHAAPRHGGLGALYVLLRRQGRPQDRP